MTNDILHHAEAYVTRFFEMRLPSWAKYHNLSHTREVVTGCREIALGMGLDGNDLEVVQLAGWFHDVGYVDGPDGHEERGVKEALAFLHRHGYPEDQQQRVAGCIRATVVPHREGTILQEVVSDADVANIGLDDFWKKGNRLRREWELRTGEKLTDAEWLERNLDFLTRCEFRTAYAQKTFGPRKSEHIAAVKKELKKLRGPADV